MIFFFHSLIRLPSFFFGKRPSLQIFAHGLASIFHHACKRSFATQQVGRFAKFQHSTMAQYQHEIILNHGIQAMGHGQDRSARKGFIQCLLQQLIRSSIYRCRRFIQLENSIGIDRSDCKIFACRKRQSASERKSSGDTFILQLTSTITYH